MYYFSLNLIFKCFSNLIFHEREGERERARDAAKLIEISKYAKILLDVWFDRQLNVEYLASFKFLYIYIFIKH